VVAAVRSELEGRVEAATTAGILPERLVLDPGLGFAKTPDHNWELLRGLAGIASLGFPLLVGASRKRFLGELLADGAGPRALDQREAANVAITLHLARQGAWGVRVHDVRTSHDALRAWAALKPEEAP
jgi:dihydropteroate synthase